jgi:hypothetical protein
MLVPTERVLTPDEGSCRDLPAILPRLREAAVGFVIALDPLVHPDLVPAFGSSPARIAPLTVHAYTLRDPLPRIAFAGSGRVRDVREGANQLELVVDAESEGTLVVRDPWAPGWSARVDGARVELAHGRRRELALRAGSHHVVMSYAPEHTAPALAASGVALAAVAWLLRRGRRTGERDAPGQPAGEDR